MAGKELKFGLVLSVVNKATAPLAAVAQAFERVGEAGEALSNLGANLRVARENVQDFADRGRAAIASVLQPTQEVEQALLDLRPIVRGWGDDVTEVLTRAEQAAIDHARATGQSATDYLAAFARVARAGHDEAGAHEAAALAMQSAAGLRLSAVDAANTLAVTYEQLGDHTRGWHDEMSRVADMLTRTRDLYGSFDPNTMKDVVKDASAAAQAAGLPLNQLLGLTGALQEAGVQGGAAAGAARGILESIETAALSAGFAVERTKDGGLDLAATLAGLQHDIETAVDPSFVRTSLAEAFGPAAWAQVSILLKSADQLEKQWGEIGSATGAAAEAHEAAAQTATAELGKMQAEWTALKLEIGRGMLPALRELVPALRDTLEPVLEFVRQNPELVATVGTYGMIAVAAANVASPMLSAASATASFAGEVLKGASETAKWFRGMPGHIKAVGEFGARMWGGVAAVEGWVASAGVAAGKAPGQLIGALRGVGAGALSMARTFWSAPIPALAAGAKAALAFTAALLTNPITWVVAAVVAAAVLIYKYWDPIKDFFGGLWGDIKAAFETSWVDGILKIIELFSPVVWIAKGLDAVTEYLFGFSLFDAGKNIVKTIGDGIAAMATWPVDKMKGVVQKIRNLLPFSPAKEGPLRDLHKVRLIETVAEAVRPDPLVRAMSGAAGAAMAALTAPASPAPLPPPPAPVSASASGPAGPTEINVTFAIDGARGDVVSQLEEWIRDPANARRLSVALQWHAERQRRAEF